MFSVRRWTDPRDETEPIGRHLTREGGEEEEELQNDDDKLQVSFHMKTSGHFFSSVGSVLVSTGLWDELRGGGGGGGEERGGGSEGPGRRSAMKRREGGLCHHMEGGEPTAFTTLSLQLQIALPGPPHPKAGATYENILFPPAPEAHARLRPPRTPPT
ncbi:hypothetical protein EYF80_040478 [Liparis tanakae]|uniref:Uncharacterized protein n=1 Tax=Liparis tanakae TaxID=230148 RepID=A0A4Z2G8L5_9TELE|nr:hypothetical protein EYF80_040478 [Liparis tanakae]